MIPLFSRLAPLLLGIALTAAADDFSQTLALSQRHHDPNSVWFRSRIRLTLSEVRADGTSRDSLVLIDNPGASFELKTKREGRQVVMSILGDKTTATLDGRLDFSKAEAEKFGLAPEGVTRRRNYYSYLYGLPMKLSDPGAQVGLPVRASKYEGRSLTKLRVAYDPKVGGDVWDFYFDPATSALSGYRFFHNEAKGDGESITLEGEIECGGGVKIPKARAWYTYKDRKFLGKDTITACVLETTVKP